jgi:hypothetical protein
MSLDGGRPTIAKGTDLIEALIGHLRFFYYIDLLENDNFIKVEETSIINEITINSIKVTEKTKDILNAILQCTSETYRHLLYIDKIRMRRIFCNFLGRSNLLETVEENKFKKSKYNSPEYIRRFKNAFTANDGNNRINEDQLEFISLLFDINIILIKPTEKKYFGTGSAIRQTICIMGINDDIYIPLLINDKFNFTHGKSIYEKLILTYIPYSLTDSEDTDYTKKINLSKFGHTSSSHSTQYFNKVVLKYNSNNELCVETSFIDIKP